MCFCFVLGYVCELFSELVGFLFGCYCSVVFEGYCVVCYGCWFFVGLHCIMLIYLFSIVLCVRGTSVGVPSWIVY